MCGVCTGWKFSLDRCQGLSAIKPVQPPKPPHRYSPRSRRTTNPIHPSPSGVPVCPSSGRTSTTFGGHSSRRFLFSRDSNSIIIIITVTCRLSFVRKSTYLRERQKEKFFGFHHFFEILQGVPVRSGPQLVARVRLWKPKCYSVLIRRYDASLIFLFYF